MAPIIELADDVAQKLHTATGFTFERRNRPYLQRADIKDGKWLVVPAGDAAKITGRQVDKCTLIVDVARQVALPEPTEEYPDPVENRTWFDNEMNQVEQIKNQFRPEGSLRDEDFLGMTLSSMTNSPIYHPELLQDQQMFVAVVRLEFIGEIIAS